MSLDLSDLKTVFMPRQWLLKKLDPSDALTVTELRKTLEPFMLQYKSLVIMDKVQSVLASRRQCALTRCETNCFFANEWGDIPVACTCDVCFPNCVRQCRLLFTSLFIPDVLIPDDWIGATVSLRMTCRKIKGTAGRKQLRLIEDKEERKCDEKKIYSKVNYLARSTHGE